MFYFYSLYNIFSPSLPPPLTPSSSSLPPPSLPLPLTPSPPHSLSSSLPPPLTPSPPHSLSPSLPLLLTPSPPHSLPPSLPPPLTPSPLTPSPPHSLHPSFPLPLTPSPLTPSPPHSLSPSPKAAKAAYVICIIGVYWMTEVVPIAVTAFLPLVLFPLLGVASARELAVTYLVDANFLFLGGLMFAVAIEKWNLHRRIALLVLIAVGSRPRW